VLYNEVFRSKRFTIQGAKSFARSERNGSLMQGLGYTMAVVTHPNHVATIFAE